MEEKKTSFTYLDSKQIEHTIEINKDDFKLTQQDKKLFDQKIQTKPTTFFKDALKRFAKNKSSVVGATILGTIVLLTLILPIALPSDISTGHAAENKLAPKLFDAGTGWWDGCRNYDHIAINTDWEKYDETGELTGTVPDMVESAIVGGVEAIKFEEMSYISAVNRYASGGYFRLNVAPKAQQAELMSWDGHTFDVSGDRTYSVTIKTADTTSFSDWKYGEITTKYSAYFVWNDATDANIEYRYPLGVDLDGVGEKTFEFSKEQLATLDDDVGRISASSQKPHLSLTLDSIENDTNNLVIEKLQFASSNENEKEELDNCSILDANKTLQITAKKEDGTPNDYYWITAHGNQNLYHARFFYGSFRYDTYEAVFGDRYSEKDITLDLLKSWQTRGWLNADFSILDNLKDVAKAERQAKVDEFIATIQYTEEGKLHCPLHLDEDHAITGKVKAAGKVVAVEFGGYLTKWKLLYPDRDTCPRYLFGTDDNGKDLLKMTFAGLRTSLVLGIITAAVTFVFGLVWGAVAGYFGGWVDILMERFTDILGGVPWIVVMTLAIVRFGSSFGVFVMALCLTGWIGTASLTRTQFYRYKNREYILAARTLGASDFRLIFRHILPNAVGTIVTSSVFMITSVIYSESTLAYLNLGLQGMDSFGVILANNQQYIMTYPHLILFPSFVMLLMMISFNLFGNGLRDAFNPSLKGGE